MFCEIGNLDVELSSCKMRMAEEKCFAVESENSTGKNDF